MKQLIALCALGLAAACTHPTDRTQSPAFGVATETVREAQIIPAAGSEAEPEGSGAVGTEAQRRYESGATRPLSPSTSAIANPSAN